MRLRVSRCRSATDTYSQPKRKVVHRSKSTAKDATRPQQRVKIRWGKSLSHRQIAACDFSTVATVTFSVLDVLIVPYHDGRQVVPNRDSRRVRMVMSCPLNQHASPHAVARPLTEHGQCRFHGWLTCHCSNRAAFKLEKSNTNDSPEYNETTRFEQCGAAVCAALPRWNVGTRFTLRALSGVESRRVHMVMSCPLNQHASPHAVARSLTEHGQCRFHVGRCATQFGTRSGVVPTWDLPSRQARSQFYRNACSL